MVVDEANANNIETYALVDMWMDQIKESIDEARTMFGMSESEFNVAWRFPQDIGMDGGEADGQSDIEPDRAV